VNRWYQRNDWSDRFAVAWNSVPQSPADLSTGNRLLTYK